MPDLVFAVAELPAWGTAVVNAISTVAQNITDIMSQVTPVALPVGGAYLAIRYGWRTAKGLTK